MAKRPEFTPDQVLSAAQLAEVRQGFSKLSLPSLQQAYAEALERCKLDRRGRAPNSIHIQGAGTGVEGAKKIIVSVSYKVGIGPLSVSSS
jgi:hypothetical protein